MARFRGTGSSSVGSGAQNAPEFKLASFEPEAHQALALAVFDGAFRAGRLLLQQMPGTAPVPSAAPVPALNLAGKRAALPDVLPHSAGKDRDQDIAGKGRSEALADLLSSARQAAVGLLAFKAVSLAAPGTMQRFNIALQDSTAVIGHRLAPVFEQVLIPAIKLFGDFLTTILPSADDFADVLSPITDFLGDLRDTLASIAPVIHDVLVVALKALGEALKLVLWPFRVLAQFIKEVFGSREATRLKSATGEAARPIHFEDPLSAVKSVYQAAFLASAGGGKKEKTPLDRIDDSVREAVKWLHAIFGEDTLIGSAVRTIGDFLKKVFDDLKYAFSHLDDVLNSVLYTISGGRLGVDPDKTNLKQEPRDPERQTALDVYARAYGEAQRKAQAVAMLPFGREQVIPSIFKDILAELRKLGEAGKAKDIEGRLEDLLNEARRRGLDGHPGGA